MPTSDEAFIDEPRRQVGAIACKWSLHRLDIAADAVTRDVWARIAWAATAAIDPDGRWAVKIALRLSRRLPVWSTLTGMPNSRPPVFGGFGSAAAGSPVALRQSRLTVRPRNEREPPHLGARSRLDPRQSSLAPPRHRPVLEGLSPHARIGRVHASCWGLAFGSGELPSAAAAARFESDSLQFGTAAEGTVTRLDGPYWVADTEGAVGAAALLVGDREVRTGPLADH